MAPLTPAGASAYAIVMAALAGDADGIAVLVSDLDITSTAAVITSMAELFAGAMEEWHGTEAAQEVLAGYLLGAASARTGQPGQ